MIGAFITHTVLKSVQHKCFYHFTDRRNLPSIKENGGILSMRSLRSQKIVVPAPGGNEWSQSADTIAGVDAFVHLSFTMGNGMAHLCRNDGRIQDLVWLKVSPEVLYLPDVLITHEVSNKRDATKLSVIDGLSGLDKEVIYTWMKWKDPAIKARLDKADQCEILVPEIVPLKYILNPDG